MKARISGIKQARLGRDKSGITGTLKKTALCAALGALLGVSGAASADIYVFSFSADGNGGGAAGTGDGLFTMLDPAGKPLANSSSPFFYDATWGYGKRTQIGGTLTYDDATRTGSMTIASFEFFNGTAPAVASGITVQYIGDGAGNPGNLLLGNMLFDWSGNNGIPVSLAWDATGLLSAINGGGLNVGSTVTGGATPASNDINQSKITIGGVPLATTTWNTALVGAACVGEKGLSCMSRNPSGTTPLTNDAIGGSPMIAGPFPANSANFDIRKLTVTAITVGLDTTPNAFPFSALTDQNTSTPLESDTVTITGIDNARTPISITGGEYRIDGGSYTSAAGTIKNNQTVQVRQTTSAAGSTTTNAVLTIGTASSTFSTTTATVFVADTIPDGFAFTNQTDVAPLTPVVSNQVTITGINTATPISVAGGSYSIDDGAATTAPGTINNNQKVTVSHTSVNGFSQTGTTTLTIGGVAATFSSTTMAIDTTPEVFSFVDQTGVSLNSTIESSEITVGGINAATQISVTGGEYSIDGGTFTNVQGTVTSGQKVRVRHASSAANNTSVDTLLTIGGVSDTFTSTTLTAGAKKFTGVFTMQDSKGERIGRDTDVTGTWDGTFNTLSNGTNFNMTLASPNTFYGYLWKAHDIRVFGPGSYVINTRCTKEEIQSGTTCASSGTPLNFTVGAGQIGAHILFDWSDNKDIDVVVVWNTDGTQSLVKTSAADGTANFTHAMTDINNDGIAGLPMVDGAFVGFNANFDLNFGSYDVTSSTPGVTIVNVTQRAVSDIPSTAGMPAATELKFGDGFVSFEVNVPNPGDSATVTISMPSIPPGSVAYWVGDDGFHQIPGAVIDYAAKTVTFTVTDGGFGDRDGMANGVVVDPVGVGAPPPPVPALGGSGGGGGGCTLNAKGGFDPVLPGLLLTVMGYFGWKRRRG